MRVQHVGYQVRGFYRIAHLGHLWEMTPKDAQERPKILRFFDKHGLAATVDAFGVSCRTLYRWKRALKEAGGNPAALAAKSCAPKRRRVPKTNRRRVAEIRRLRTLYPNMGKEKLHVWLAPWCAKQGIALPSVSTIGRIISRAPDKMRLTPHRLDARGRVKPVRCARKARKPQDLKPAPLTLWAVDTIERVRDGIRRYILTFIDPASHFAFAVATPGKTSRYTSAALNAALSLLPAKPQVLLSSNGSEFAAGFAKTLDDHGIAR